MQKRKRILLLVLLLLGGLLFYWFTQRKEAIKALPAHFIVQDSALHIKGDTLLIKVWDYNAVDGDTVNILFDGKTIFKKLGLEGEPVYYSARKLSSGEHWLGVEGIMKGPLLLQHLT